MCVPHIVATASIEHSVYFAQSFGLCDDYSRVVSIPRRYIQLRSPRSLCLHTEMLVRVGNEAN